MNAISIRSPLRTRPMVAVSPTTKPVAHRAGTTPLHALEAKELMRRLAECLRALPTAWRAVLALRDGEGKTYEQIAEALHVELGTVRSRLARARTSLKECIEGRTA